MIAKLETEGRCKILRVSGRIDFESALDFEQQINSMIQQDGDCFIIELAEVELLSSAGLRVLLSTAKRVSHRDAALGLAAPSQVVRQVFEISHFNLLFKIFPSVAEAIAALKGPTHSAEPASLRVSAGNSANAPPVQATEPTSSGRLTLVPPLAEPRAAIAEAAPPIVSRPPPVLPLVPAPQVAPPPAAAETILPSAQPPAVSKTPVTPPPQVSESAPPAARSPKTPPPLEVAKPRPPQSPPVARRISEPPSLPGAETAVPIGRPPQPPSVARPSGPPPRVEASYPAQLEVRAEGNSYPCKDGDVIGGAGHLGKAYFIQIPGLAPRHLLIGKLDGRWFIFTPQNVQHPFLFDGHLLVAGERKFLQYTEHQLEFNGHVFGLRLMPESRKQGFFARIFGKK